MKNIKRTVRQHGRILGHRAGLVGGTLLPYIEARKQIYLPAYRWVLEKKVDDLIEKLRSYNRDTTVVLLDYNTNTDIHDINSPLSHAALIVRYIDGEWDTED